MDTYRRQPTARSEVAFRAAFFVALSLVVLFLFAISETLAAQPPDGVQETVAAQHSAVAVGNLHALIVGVSRYSHPKIPALKVSDKDAKDFADFLKSQGKLFRDIHLELLLNERATKREIEKQLFYKLRQAGKDDTVVLFFSGHGADDANMPGEFFFLTHDAEPDALEASAVNLSRMRFMARLDSRRVLLIADTCHAGGFSIQGQKRGEPTLEGFMRKFKESEGRVILTSCRPDEVSLERSDVGNSLFTHCLLRGLRGAADSNRDGVVTLKEAYEYMYEETKKASKGVQHPQLEGKLEGEFPLSLLVGQGGTLELLVDQPETEVYLRDKAQFTFVNKTDEQGRILLRDLPAHSPLFVMLRKDGWKEVILGPLLLPEGETYMQLPKTKLDPAVSFLALKTSSPNVSVWQGEKLLGTTGPKGILILDRVQVGVSCTYTLKKPEHQDKSVEITVPGSYEGKVYTTALIEVQKSGEIATREATPQGSIPETHSKYAGDAVVRKVDLPDGCLCIRKGPSPSSEKVGCAALGERLVMTGLRSANNWVELSEPGKGWVYANHISAKSLPPFSASPTGQPQPDASAVAPRQKQPAKTRRSDDDDDGEVEVTRRPQRDQAKDDDQPWMPYPQQYTQPPGAMGYPGYQSQRSGQHSRPSWGGGFRRR